MATGTAVVDFGVFPGQSDASLDVVTAGVVAGSRVEAWIQPAASADHSADEHMVETLKVFGYYLSDGNIRLRVFNTGTLSEPLEPETFNGAMIQGSATAVAWRAATSPGSGARGGGRGTRIYGTWNVAWAWV